MSEKPTCDGLIFVIQLSIFVMACSFRIPKDQWGLQGFVLICGFIGLIVSAVYFGKDSEFEKKCDRHYNENIECGIFIFLMTCGVIGLCIPMMLDDLGWATPLWFLVGFVLWLVGFLCYVLLDACHKKEETDVEKEK